MVSVLVVFLLTAQAAHPVSQADALFKEARKKMSSGKALQACPLFEKSHETEPALGTLLNLAQCYDQTGKFVQAYLKFNEASEWATRTNEVKRAHFAQERASQLKSKLSWLVIRPTVAVKNCVVFVNAFKIDLLDTPQSVPVDSGEVEIRATAPGYVDLRDTVNVPPKQSVSYTVPRLEAAVVDAPMAEKIETTQPLLEPNSKSATKRSMQVVQRIETPASRAAPIATLVVGLTVTAVGTAGLIHSYMTLDARDKQQVGQLNYLKPTVTLQEAKTIQWMYPASWVAVGVGAATTIAGAIWLGATPKSTVKFVPLVQGDRAGISMSGEF